MMESLRYPIGEFQPPAAHDNEQVKGWIKEIESLPSLLRETVIDLKELDLHTSYREGGWNIKQLVHHIADSHMNSFIRFKLAITEDTPTINPYDEVKWAELVDSNGPIIHSITIIDGLHARWVQLLQSLDEKDLTRTFKHPDLGNVTLLTALSLYAWHGAHHLEHIKLAIKELNHNIS